jgi:SNF2 family DNA or RNA helicase
MNAPAPDLLHGLMAHQRTGVAWLLDRPRAMLAWEMGVGKTAALVRAWELSRELGPALVICLNTARANWVREINHFALDPYWPPKILTARGSGHSFGRDRADIIIINYEKLLIPVWRQMVRGGRWGTMIIDEAHRLKNPQAKTTRTVYGPQTKKKYGALDPIDATRLVGDGDADA